MDLELELQGSDATEETTIAVQDWIRREQIEGLRVERKSAPAVEGQMGIDPLTALSVVLGSAAVVELVKSLHVWIRTRRPQLKIKLKVGDSDLEINAQNLPDQQALIERALTIAKASGAQ